MFEPEIILEKVPQSISGLQKQRQLLVVDDNEGIRKTLSNMLSSMGYGVTLAGNGIEAANLFRSGSYDLVLTDIRMPLMDGWELSRLVKNKSPKTPVIVITGSYSDKKWEKVNVSCVDAIIPKPFKLKEIETTVQRLLKSGRHATGSDSSALPVFV